MAGLQVLLNISFFQRMWKKWELRLQRPHVTPPPVSQPSKWCAMASSQNSEEYHESNKGASKPQVRQAEEVTSIHLIWEPFCLERWVSAQWVSVPPSHPLGMVLFQWQGGTVAGRLVYGQAGKFTPTPTCWHRSSSWNTTSQHCQISPCQYTLTKWYWWYLFAYRDVLNLIIVNHSISHYEAFLSTPDISHLHFVFLR